MAQVAQAARMMTRPAKSFAALSRCVTNPQPAKHAEVFSEERLFQAYAERTPTAVRALDILASRGGSIHNDHMALRSFVDSQGRSGREFFETIFTHFGYAVEDSLVIPGLCVNARWYEPPEETNWPKIFVSEMRIDELPDPAAEILYRHVDGFYDVQRAKAALADGAGAVAELLETLWEHEMGSDNAIEYAAWTLTHGHRINHVTILLNTLGLDGVQTLADLNALLQSQGLEFNPAGGTDGWTQARPSTGQPGRGPRAEFHHRGLGGARLCLRIPCDRPLLFLGVDPAPQRLPRLPGPERQRHLLFHQRPAVFAASGGGVTLTLSLSGALTRP
eukprot:s5039_g2.t1